MVAVWALRHAAQLCGYNIAVHSLNSLYSVLVLIKLTILPRQWNSQTLCVSYNNRRIGSSCLFIYFFKDVFAAFLFKTSKHKLTSSWACLWSSYMLTDYWVVQIVTHTYRAVKINNTGMHILILRAHYMYFW